MEGAGAPGWELWVIVPWRGSAGTGRSAMLSAMSWASAERLSRTLQLRSRGLPWVPGTPVEAVIGWWY